MTLLTTDRLLRTPPVHGVDLERQERVGSGCLPADWRGVRCIIGANRARRERGRAKALKLRRVPPPEIQFRSPAARAPLRRRLSRIEPFDLPGEAGLDVEALGLQGRGHERRFDRPGLGRPRNRARRRVGGIALHRRPDPPEQEVSLRLQRPRLGLVGERLFLARSDHRVERGSALCPSADWRLADPSKRGFVPTESTARVDVNRSLKIVTVEVVVGGEGPDVMNVVEVIRCVLAARPSTLRPWGPARPRAVR